MGILSGLENLEGEVEVEGCFSSVTDGLKNLRAHRAKCTAGDLGAINIWYDDNGVYRGERMAYYSTISKVSVNTLKELGKWLKEEFPLIGR